MMANGAIIWVDRRHGDALCRAARMTIPITSTHDASARDSTMRSQGLWRGEVLRTCRASRASGINLPTRSAAARRPERHPVGQAHWRCDISDC